jgi:hypothetical protein
MGSCSAPFASGARKTSISQQSEFDPRIAITSIAYQLSRIRDTPWSGSSKPRLMAPFSGVFQPGESSKLKCPARSSSAFCSAGIFRGDPILFQTS